MPDSGSVPNLVIELIHSLNFFLLVIFIKVLWFQSLYIAILLDVLCNLHFKFCFITIFLQDLIQLLSVFFEFFIWQWFVIFDGFVDFLKCHGRSYNIKFRWADDYGNKLFIFELLDNNNLFRHLPGFFHLLIKL